MRWVLVLQPDPELVGGLVVVASLDDIETVIATVGAFTMRQLAIDYHGAGVFKERQYDPVAPAPEDVQIAVA